MAENDIPPNYERDDEQPLLELRYHPVNKVARKIYDFMASAKLAMLLLVSILLGCLCGGIFFKEPQATEMVFGTLWFNGLLVLLVINVICCFFGRIWGRRVTVISFGMILFHLSFVAMFVAIVFNSLFCFNGTLRLTEGESLSNRDPKSYDNPHPGLFFSYSRMKGETSLLRVHRGYKVDGGDKLIAFDVSIADGGITNDGVVFINNKFKHKAVEYIRDQEGYSLLTIVNDKSGKELYGAHIPLQSLKQKDSSYLYSTGSMTGPGSFNFPPEKDKTLFALQLTYYPDLVKDRSGKVRFQVWPTLNAGADHTMNPSTGGITDAGGPHMGGGAMGTGGGHAMNPSAGGAMEMDGNKNIKPLADGTMKIAETFAFGEYQLIAPEVRYWVAMTVRYNPGKPVVLTSLWVGLAGLIVTAIGRIARRRS